MNDPLIIKHEDADIPPVWRLAALDDRRVAMLRLEARYEEAA